MLTIREIQSRTVTFFDQKGVPDPKLDTDLLIAEVLGLKRLDLYLDLDRPLTEAQLDELRPLVKRRAAREPLQYLLGYTEFCGMRLRVTPDVLIPRPETEMLVELLRDRIASAPGSILDLGTGSGALAIALAAAYPGASVTATDRSAAALNIARENARQLLPENTIDFREGDWWRCIADQERFDLIVANPPYLTEAELETAAPEVRAHEPHGALVAGREGLDDLRRILTEAKSHLSTSGQIALETGIAQHARMDDFCAASGLIGESLEDLSGRPRFFLAKPA